MSSVLERSPRWIDVSPFAWLRQSTASIAACGSNLDPAGGAYLAAISVAAVIVSTYTAARAGVPSADHAALAVLFSALLAMAWLFPLPFSFKTDLYLDTSVLLVALLSLEPGHAILATGAGTALAQGLRRRQLAETLFNSAQVVLQTGSGAAVLAVAGWQVGASTFDQPAAIAAVVMATVAMVLTTDIAVATMVALQSGTTPARAWLTSIGQTGWGDGLAQAAQASLGIVAAILVDTLPWTLYLLLVPGTAISFSLRAAHAQRRRVEANLRDTEGALAEVERIAHLGSWAWDLTTGDVTWSDEARRILGAMDNEPPPTWQRYLAAVHPGDRPAVDRAVHASLAAQRPFCLEHRVVRPDGAERIVQAQGEVVRSATGLRRRVVGTLLDVTGRRQAEQAREELLASLSHDLKSPLTVILGNAQLLQRRLDQASGLGGVRSGLDRIEATAKAMTAQITELLEVARQDMESPLVIQPVDLVELARERATYHQLATGRHQIQTDAREPELLIRGDRARIERAVDNLLSNAVKYSPDGGEIRVRVECERDGSATWAVLSVQDSGIGIPSGDLPRVFERFWRGSNVGAIDGSGIGLAAVKQAVALHGGTVAAASEEGKGSTLSLRLPLAP